MYINIYNFNPLSSQMLEKEQEENRKMKQMLEEKDRRIAELEREVYLLNKVRDKGKSKQMMECASMYQLVYAYKNYQYSNSNAHLQVCDLRLSLSYTSYISLIKTRA